MVCEFYSNRKQNKYIEWKNLDILKNHKMTPLGMKFENRQN